MTNTNALRKAIEASGLKYKFVAKHLELSTYGLTKKINNTTEFKASEIDKLTLLLSLSDQQRNDIFFAQASD